MSASTPNPTAITFRRVKPSDKEALEAISNAVWSTDSYFNYLCPFAKDNPEDLAEKLRLTVESNFIAVSHDRLIAQVAEGPSKTNSAKTEIVAYAIYEAPGAHTLSADESPARRDWQERLHAFFERHPVNSSRTKEANRVITDVGKSWFDDEYGTRQLTLITVAVHPDHQQKGIGSSLVQWGINSAFNQGVPVVLFCTEASKGFYSKLGFQSTGSQRVQVAGETEFHDIEGMVYDASYAAARVWVDPMDSSP